MDDMSQMMLCNCGRCRECGRQLEGTWLYLNHKGPFCPDCFDKLQGIHADAMLAEGAKIP